MAQVKLADGLWAQGSRIQRVQSFNPVFVSMASKIIDDCAPARKRRGRFNPDPLCFVLPTDNSVAEEKG